MDEFEDYSEEISRRRAKLSPEKRSYRVAANHLLHEGFNKVYRELDVDSCLGNNWKKLAGVLLKPPPTAATIEHLCNSKSQACELFKTWVSQGNVSKTFDSLIETMVECKLYSACDELLDYLESLNLDLDKHYESEVNAANKFTTDDEVNDRSDDQTEMHEPNPATSNHINAQKRSRSLDEIVSFPDRVGVSGKTSEQQNSRVANEQGQQRPYPPKSTRKNKCRSRVIGVQRSISCPERSRWWKKLTYPLRKIKDRFKRSISSPAGMCHSTPTLVPPTEPAPLPPQDEIFILSSFEDNKTKAMKDLMSFVRKLKLVKTSELTVRTIHDIDQGGLVTTAWLEERVMRARYVILCFSDNMKKITQSPSQYEHQTDYNLKFTMDFLVTGTIFDNCGRNPSGKFIPLVLGEYDRSSIVSSLRQFQNFCWPDEKEKIQKYILNLPEYPPPQQGCRKPLVRKEISC